MDRILVTGGTTFSGLHLVRSLVRDGHAVRVLTPSLARARALLPAETEILVGEVTERDDVVRAMDGREVVYHLADSAGTGRVTSAHDHWCINVQGTRLVMQAAMDAKARRVVHCGTARVHGDTGRSTANEESAFQPTNAFELTKLQGERLAMLFVRECGLPVAIARPTWTYGADDRRFRRMMASVRRGHVVIPGTRRARVHPIHVDDLVRGLKLLATRDDAVGEAFILGGPEHLALDELITVLARAVAVKRPQVHIPELSTRLLMWASERFSFTGSLRGRLEFFTKSHVFDIGKASRVLGFTPRVPVFEGVGRTVLWEERVALVARNKGQSRRRADDLAPRPSGELRRRYALSDDALIVGSVSRFFPVAGTRHLIDAFPRVRAAVPSARLLIVGEGTEREVLERQASRLGISPFVIFAGMHDDIAAHLRLCDVAVVSSTDDGLSLAAMEALSAGIPLVATRVGGLASIVRDGENGLLVPPGDADALAAAVIRVLRNPELRGELAARNSAAVRGGAFDQWAEATPRAANG
ncbi:MAG: glycosyltransferase [Gemmatimonadota bacterium]